ncbi:MAG TPA: hypothetical protein VFU69_07080 [Ktedonobacterales bacterium]|nr:hypothetical protein [Ktedonobacterales bacterium]
MGITIAMTSLARWGVRHRPGRHVLGCLLGALLLIPLALAACNEAPPPSNDAALNQLHWCDKQTLLFQDASQFPAVPLTDWAQVKTSLDFTVYLPERLPVGSCLVSGEALIHDKVLGSSFGISYLLPGGVSLALSETAAAGNQAAAFQCSPSSSVTPTSAPTSGTPTATATPGTPTPTPIGGNTLLCLGAKGQTNVVMDSSESEKDLQATFNGLKANVDWIPKK